MDWTKTAWAAAALVACFAVIAEFLHARRCRRVARLAFGPDSKPRTWTLIATPLRIASLAGLAWSLLTLLASDGRSQESGRKPPTPRDMVLLLDVSPSMKLRDAGADGKMSREEQAAAVVRSILDRIPPDYVRITLIAFYSDAKPLVSRCSDREVIWNFLNKMPLVYAFNPGKTDLIKAVNKAGEVAKDIPRKNATLVVLTDGDTINDTGLLPLPSPYADSIVVGFGDRLRGIFIDGHSSRQDDATLAQLARRIGGVYHDGNAKQVPTALLKNLAAPMISSSPLGWTLRTWALAVMAVSVTILALLPVALQNFGSGWKVRGDRVRKDANNARTKESSASASRPVKSTENMASVGAES
jgi:Ca-activated chloride channel family protein